MKNLIEMIYQSSNNYKQKTAFADFEVSFTYGETKDLAEHIASSILRNNQKKQPIAIFMERSAKIPVAMAGTILSGNFYAILDTESPIERLNKIITTLDTKFIICDEQFETICKQNFKDCIVISFENLCKENINNELINEARNLVKEDDLAFTIFTSGSTGDPKGTMITHKNVLSYINWFVNCFNIDSNIVFGSQTPYYFSMSVSDLYGSWMSGATYNLIPKSYFAFPAKLIDYINERKVNTIYWVPTALGIVAKFDLLNYIKPLYLENIFFAGEVMPIKYLNYWRKYLPEAKYVNLFGPTETTDICSYYVVNRDFKEDETLPIGTACEGLELLIIDEKNKLITTINESGELYVSGPFVTKGYYNNEVKTKENFVLNPLNQIDIVYKTGDLVAYNDKNELVYLGRKDFQIKHLGYRIELGEIESVMNGVTGIELSICLYDAQNDEIILFYEGIKEKKNDIIIEAKNKLPEYMVPNKVIHVDAFPINANGKIDKITLKKEYM